MKEKQFTIRKEILISKEQAEFLRKLAYQTRLSEGAIIRSAINLLQRKRQGLPL